MAWFSILPSDWSVLEIWIIRLFLFLGILTIGPWAIFIVYDLLLYIFRAATYEIPVIGGRARGRQRPRAPSLTERPSGRPRTFSMGVPIASGETNDELVGLRERLREGLRGSEGEDQAHESETELISTK